jgi:hypothetical protein
MLARLEWVAKAKPGDGWSPENVGGSTRSPTTSSVFERRLEADLRAGRKPGGGRDPP